ncbi:MAG: sigma-70 family RNA polymerase sigma factor [Cyclobacteriaceae bacterium]|nr:sigma-70 family RNA polymerase sigma factor [Cyclobacteriaceae bacterium]MCB9238064.1 sigma-70 family RNA polymerase sigma factor [Flammeovirgaceae bacterium]MCO5272544.1 sigma-70 family RNA polymerase sigma factor [Cyclobacteriaceae bacterium]MCW5901612.1 sigma-70 family RNA polymerase sigma factor [Cyclobacteriaceae bacterium]
MFVGKGPSKSSDEALVERFRSANDTSALAGLFTRYSAMAYGVCLKYLKDRDEAKDAVMHIFEKLHRDLKGHVITYFKGWLYVTCKNHCLMVLRARKKMANEGFREGLMENQAFLHHDEEEGREQDLTRLEKCIEELKNGQKACVKLFYLKEMCYKEIVKATGIEMKQVKSHIQNGKRNLKTCMERSGQTK